MTTFAFLSFGKLPNFIPSSSQKFMFQIMQAQSKKFNQCLNANNHIVDDACSAHWCPQKYIVLHFRITVLFFISIKKYIFFDKRSLTIRLNLNKKTFCLFVFLFGQLCLSITSRKTLYFQNVWDVLWILITKETVFPPALQLNYE